jgi:hypothetical protein
MKKIYVDLNSVKSMMSPLGYNPMKSFTAYDLKNPRLTEFINHLQYDKALITLTRVMNMKTIEEIKEFVSLNMRNLHEEEED